jgi:hypothetical protein
MQNSIVGMYEKSPILLQFKHCGIVQRVKVIPMSGDVATIVGYCVDGTDIPLSYEYTLTFPQIVENDDGQNVLIQRTNHVILGTLTMSCLNCAVLCFRDTPVVEFKKLKSISVFKYDGVEIDNI